MREFFCARTKISDFSQLYMYILRAKGICIFGRKVRIGHNSMHFFGRKHLCHAALSKFIRGSQDNNLVRLFCQGANCAAACMVDVGKAAFFREAVDALLCFLAYIQNIIEMISNGGVFIVDEMSARLHPLLTKLIVDIFCSSQNKKAQLIFTTHDISLLNNNQFRRDEVVFIDKNERGESSLYALSDLKVREDATFNKDYLQGKYGAIPIFNYDDIMGGELLKI